MIGNVLLACSVLVLVLSLYETFLNAKQKELVESHFLGACNWIDDFNSRQIAFAKKIVSPLSNWSVALFVLIALFAAAGLLDLVILPILYFLGGEEEAGAYIVVDILVFALLIAPLILTLASIVVVRTISKLFSVIEFLVRRIAEQPKIMVTVSGLTTAIMGVLKSSGKAP
jgi:hypothetical protein